MAISFVGSASDPTLDGGNCVITLPAMLQNDLVIVAYHNENATDFNMAMVTAGYTEVADLFSNDSNDSNLGVFYKFMGASPDATAETTGSNNTNVGEAAVAMVFRGVDTAGPFDVASTTATGTNSANADPPSIDWNTVGVWVVIAGGSSYDPAGATFTFPSGYTVNAKQQSASDVVGALVGIGYNSSPGDPENPGVMTSDGSALSQAWSAVTMALKPAVGISGGTTDGFGIPIF